MYNILGLVVCKDAIVLADGINRILALLLPLPRGNHLLEKSSLRDIHLIKTSNLEPLLLRVRFVEGKRWRLLLPGYVAHRRVTPHSPIVDDCPRFKLKSLAVSANMHYVAVVQHSSVPLPNASPSCRNVSFLSLFSFYLRQWSTISTHPHEILHISFDASGALLLVLRTDDSRLYLSRMAEIEHLSWPFPLLSLPDDYQGWYEVFLELYHLFILFLAGHVPWRSAINGPVS